MFFKRKARDKKGSINCSLLSLSPVEEQEYREWQRQNPYFGRRVSILGDSISTLEGYNPQGYNLFYTLDDSHGTGVTAAENTWWGAVISYLGASLLVNDSWSGSRITKLPLQRELFPSGCSDERTGGLHRGSEQPDLILVYLGTNDWGFGVPLTPKNLYEFETPDEYVFSIACPEMFRKLRDCYPRAEICCIPITRSRISSKPDFVYPEQLFGVSPERFNAEIRRSAEEYGCRFLDLNGYHVPYDSIDGSHPNVSGMRTIAALVLRALCGPEGTRFLADPAQY